MGSLSEIETQLLLSRRFNYLDDHPVFNDIEAIRKMLVGLSKFLKEKEK